MRNNMLTIIKKEFVRFFGDKRLVFTTVLLPGLMIYVLYTFMGQGIMNQFETSEDYVYQIYAENLPQSAQMMLEEMPVEVEKTEKGEREAIKELIANKELDLLLVFPEDFDAAVAAYDSMNAGSEAAPLIAMYYNSTNTGSNSAYRMMTEAFDTYEALLANKFDINAGEDDYDLASEKDETGQFFSMMLPMLMMIFLFSGCMAIAPESIAGEKERGTIATLLVTPMKRSHLALGKIISLSIIGLLSGISSFVGTMLSLPSMMAGASDTLSASVYTATDYAMLLLVILTTVLVIVAALSVISAFSKSVKEASNAIMPLMIIVMVVAVTSMMTDGAPTEWYFYLIPFYNSVQCMNGVFGFTYLPMNIVITLVSNLVYTLILAGGLAKIFDSEKIMYL
jgi:sodium transport system permease protein